MTELISDIGTALPRLIERGLSDTLYSFLGGAVLMIITAVVLGLALHQGPAWLRTIARIIVEFFRGTSLIVQLFFLYYVLRPIVADGLGVDAVGLGIVAAMVALGLNYGAYGAEVVRGSLNAVPRGQWESATALSMPWLLKIRRIIWPQAWALMLPGFNNLAVMLVKGTAAVALIQLSDLTFFTDNVLRRQVGTWGAFLAVLLVYLAIALIVSTFFRWMERRAQRRLGIRMDRATTAKATARAVG